MNRNKRVPSNGRSSAGFQRTLAGTWPTVSGRERDSFLSHLIIVYERAEGRQRDILIHSPGRVLHLFHRSLSSFAFVLFER